MAKSKEIIIAGINDKAGKKDLSDIMIGEEFQVDDLMNVTEKSGRTTKKRAQEKLIALRDKIIEKQFQSYELERKCKIYQKKLEQHPAVIALKEMRKEIKRNKKQIEAFAAYYQGGFDTVRAAGIDVDPTIMKALKEALNKEA